jgi:pyruvate dehydrogenase E2 component (dihydrolipoamide acetyltransferase)
VAQIALEIPKVGLVMESARVVRWLKQRGEPVRQGEPLVELETEKSIVEIESPVSGRLTDILLEVDQEARVGDRLGWLEGAQPEGVAAPSERAAPLPTAAPIAAASQSVHPGQGRGDRIKSSPAARRLAAEHDIDLRHVTGTGPLGRVRLLDVHRTMGQDSAGQAAVSPAGSPQPLPPMRRALARAMTLSNATVPQFAVERAVDWTALHEARARLLTGTPGAKPSINDFLLQASARALLAFPALNATFSGEADSPNAALVPSRGTHVGLAVAVENGLRVPVFHDVERLRLAELAQRRGEAVARALQGRSKSEELEGGTFSISNLGGRGPDRFVALINPPQSAILAVGRQQDCVVALQGAIVVRPMSRLTLTVDHRVADGRLAADFLAHLIDILEGSDWQ